MDKWLDSLSEDWPSQPPSQHNSSSLLQHNGSPQGGGSKRRLPRRRRSDFSSVSSIREREQGKKRLGAPKNHTADAPLKERSFSSLNAVQRPSSHERAKLFSSDAAGKPSKTYSRSASSTPSVPTGTVAYKASPTKEGCETPEWKRRVVQGKIGHGDQTDMFGPIGLQSVFRPPSTSTKIAKGEKQIKSQIQMSQDSEALRGFPSRVPSDPDLGNVRSSGQPSTESDDTEKWEDDMNSSKQANPRTKNLVEEKTSQLPVTAPRSSTQYPETSIAKPMRTPLYDSRIGSDINQSGSNSFSAFIVSKSQTMDGKVDYAAVSHKLKHLNLKVDDQKEVSQLESRNPGPNSNDLPLEIRANSTMSFRKSLVNEITSESLPEDLSVGTDAYAANGGFVSVRRGGYSNEGSFKERSLSPSPAKDVDEPKDYSEGSSIKHPSPPVTPRKEDEEQLRSSGSPLKLFDKYDTFTNNRLARHISRFEETLAQNGTPEIISEDEEQPSSPSPGPKVSRKTIRTNQSQNDLSRRRVRSFGSGELDDLNFTATGSNDGELSLPYFPRSASIERHSSRHKQDRKVSRGSRYLSSAIQRVSTGISDFEDAKFLNDEDNASQFPQGAPEVSYTINGKRLPDSPKKKAARKRRRTLCSSEEHKRAALDAQRTQPRSLVEETPHMAANGRKRKDARHGSEKQAADPKTLAMRQILRPRNPTPNQTGSSARQTPLAKLEPAHDESKGDSAIVSGHVSTGSIAKVDPPTHIVAGALANIALNTVQDMETGSRKVSVTTSDFFNEAQQIMALIRAERRPRSSHNSAETSNLGPLITHGELSMADSTRDDLTRPPSREGGSLRNLQLPTHRDARVVSHLRKFEDKDDLGLALPSSGKSLKISHCDVASVASAAKLKDEDQPNGFESDPPNIRIRAAITDNEYRDRSSLRLRDTDSQKGREAHKVDSHNPSESSGRKSIPTGSSQGSSNIKKIAPQSVAHLLSDQMADMFFDKERQVWVKRKSSTGQDHSNSEVHATSEGTEEDLFGGIPDLSVDEMKELEMVKNAVSLSNTLGSGRCNASAHNQAAGSVIQNRGRAPQDSNQNARPRTAEGQMILANDNSSAPSKHTNFAWSGPIPGTRATSYGDEVWPDKRAQEHQPPGPHVLNSPPSPETEHEISIFDGRENHLSAWSAKERRQTRVVTVAFSSPLIQSPHQLDENWDDIDPSGLEESPSKHASQLQLSTKKPISSIPSRFQRRVSHRVSIGNSSIIARPMSRLDEQDEMSLVHYSTKDPRTSTDLARMTPLPPSGKWIVPASGQRSSIGFELSPLPDFTVHQIDQPLDTKDIVGFDQYQARNVSNALSITAQEILKHLTDLEPYEPYWYHIQKVVLRDRGLTSLHMLDQFCGRIQDLDVSKNDIRDLDGVPSTVRSLNIRDNCLSELTSWQALLHLQYLDISGNQVRSLKAFQDLLHLRSLTADDNQIESLDGIECLDGLLSLRLRNNHLSSVSFERFNLKRLVRLDLQGNKLKEVAKLNGLESLEALNLSMNGIRDLCFENLMLKLRTLNLADNHLNHIDISHVPNLRILVIDRNAVNKVEGLAVHTKLESLLWREQKIATAFDNQLQDCHEIRNLYLSSTCLPSTFKSKASFLNLNTLEMASMGLQSMPEDFGMMCKNLRSLNLNYNAVHDIRPLLGITRLRSLYVAGNRISRLRRTAAVLDRLSSELLELDLRNNTLTVGFYTPQPPSTAGIERRLVVHNTASSPSSFSADDERDYIAESAQAHLLPNLDKDADTASRERLDEDTKLRRRVYEMLLVSACKLLHRLDGLEVDRRAVAKRDGVWERLVELDVLKAKV